MADHLAGVEILDPGKIQPALPGRYVGDIGDPGLVGSTGFKLLSKEIGRHRQMVRGIRGHCKLAPLLTA